MSRDSADRDALKGVADSLVGERASLQRRLQQIRSELESETKEAQALEQGELRKGASSFALAKAAALQQSPQGNGSVSAAGNLACGA